MNHGSSWPAPSCFGRRQVLRQNFADAVMHGPDNIGMVQLLGDVDLALEPFSQVVARTRTSAFFWSSGACSQGPHLVGFFMLLMSMAFTASQHRIPPIRILPLQVRFRRSQHPTGRRLLGDIALSHVPALTPMQNFRHDGSSAEQSLFSYLTKDAGS